jgi:A/G-specific adenine glycosylase
VVSFCVHFFQESLAPSPYGNVQDIVTQNFIENNVVSFCVLFLFPKKKDGGVMEFEKIVEPLLRWYEKNARQLPWRDDPTPYRVWISEIMLQQTRVEAVKPYFERFVRELPNVKALAEVPDEKLLKLWEGLGYYSRARSLKKAAILLMERFGGELPTDVEQLRKLPGIGDYTAGSIASIAFGLPEPAVDGNVLRVAARLQNSREDITQPAVKKELRERLKKVYPKEQASAFTQSLMELGATVCLPNGEPLCGECPLAELCEAHRAGTQNELPVKAAKPKRRVENRTVFLILSNGTAALRRRPETGLLAGMWEFPCQKGTLTPEQAEKTLAEWEIKAETIEPLPAAKHIFSHVEWHMTGYLVKAEKPVLGFVWASPEEVLGDYPVPSAYRAYLKILRHLAGEK